MPNPACVREEAGDNPLNNMLAGASSEERIRQARNRHADRGSNAAFASSRPKDRTVLYGFGD